MATPYGFLSTDQKRLRLQEISERKRENLKEWQQIPLDDFITADTFLDSEGKVQKVGPAAIGPLQGAVNTQAYGTMETDYLPAPGDDAATAKAKQDKFIRHRRAYAERYRAPLDEVTPNDLATEGQRQLNLLKQKAREKGQSYMEVARTGGLSSSGYTGRIGEDFSVDNFLSSPGENALYNDFTNLQGKRVMDATPLGKDFRRNREGVGGLRQLGDTLASAGTGLVDIGKMGGLGLDFLGTDTSVGGIKDVIPGMEALSAASQMLGVNPVETGKQALEAGDKFFESLKSPQARTRRADQMQRLQSREADKERRQMLAAGGEPGTGDKIVDWLKEWPKLFGIVNNDPKVILDMASEELPSMGITGILGKAAAKEALNRIGREIAEEGADFSTKQIQKKVRKAYMAAGLSSEAVEAGLGAGVEAKEKIMEMDAKDIAEKNPEDWAEALETAGGDEEKAKEILANKAALATTGLAAMVGLVVGGMTGGVGLEAGALVPRILPDALKDTIVKKTLYEMGQSAESLGRNVLEDAIAEPLEQVATNVGVNTVTGDEDLTADTGMASVLGATIGGTIGAAVEGPKLVAPASRLTGAGVKKAAGAVAGAASKVRPGGRKAGGETVIEGETVEGQEGTTMPQGENIEEGPPREGVIAKGVRKTREVVENIRNRKQQPEAGTTVAEESPAAEEPPVREEGPKVTKPESEVQVEQPAGAVAEEVETAEAEEKPEYATTLKQAVGAAPAAKAREVEVDRRLAEKRTGNSGRGPVEGFKAVVDTVRQNPPVDKPGKEQALRNTINKRLVTVEDDENSARVTQAFLSRDKDLQTQETDDNPSNTYSAAQVAKSKIMFNPEKYIAGPSTTQEQFNKDVDTFLNIPVDELNPAERVVRGELAKQRTLPSFDPEAPNNSLVNGETDTVELGRPPVNDNQWIPDGAFKIAAAISGVPDSNPDREERDFYGYALGELQTHLDVGELDLAKQKVEELRDAVNKIESNFNKLSPAGKQAQQQVMDGFRDILSGAEASVQLYEQASKPGSKPSSEAAPPKVQEEPPPEASKPPPKAAKSKTGPTPQGTPSKPSTSKPAAAQEQPAQEQPASPPPQPSSPPPDVSEEPAVEEEGTPVQRYASYRLRMGSLESANDENKRTVIQNRRRDEANDIIGSTKPVAPLTQRETMFANEIMSPSIDSDLFDMNDPAERQAAQDLASEAVRKLRFTQKSANYKPVSDDWQELQDRALYHHEGDRFKDDVKAGVAGTVAEEALMSRFSYKNNEITTAINKLTEGTDSFYGSLELGDLKGAENKLNEFKKFLNNKLLDAAIEEGDEQNFVNIMMRGLEAKLKLEQELRGLSVEQEAPEQSEFERREQEIQEQAQRQVDEMSNETEPPLGNNENIDTIEALRAANEQLGVALRLGDIIRALPSGTNIVIRKTC